MVGTGAVTGEKAGTRHIDELPGAECLLPGAVVGCAAPEAPLLADAVGEGKEEEPGPAWAHPAPPAPSQTPRVSGTKVLRASAGIWSH